MQGCARKGKPKEAVQLFDEMRQRGCEVDVAAYNALLAALCNGGEMEEAERRLKEMRTVHGLDPDAGTYAVFVRAYCEAGDSRSALRMLENTKRKGLVPNVFTYNCVIRLLCEKEEKAEEAYELLDEMLERGLEPDVWSYNRILALHCKLREANKATKLLKRMDEAGCLPDRHTYNMLIKMLIGVGRIDRAMEVWDGMEGRGFYPSACSYAVMIHGLCRKKGRVEEACRYLEAMVDEGVPPYDSTCVLLRSELLRVGLRERVEVVVDRMRRSSSCKIQELSRVMETGKGIEKEDKVIYCENKRNSE